jgi:hypothetical protein
VIGKPIFDYPPERRAPQSEGCTTCGIVLEADAIGNYCSPECCEWPDRCESCDRGQTWCQCEYTHCIDCGDPLPNRDRERGFRTCKRCAEDRRQARFDIRPRRQDASSKEIT